MADHILSSAAQLLYIQHRILVVNIQGVAISGSKAQQQPSRLEAALQPFAGRQMDSVIHCHSGDN